jgi:hypothetical protein
LWFSFNFEKAIICCIISASFGLPAAVELLAAELELDADAAAGDDFVAGIGLSLGIDAPFGEAVGSCAKAEISASNTLAAHPTITLRGRIGGIFMMRRLFM